MYAFSCCIDLCNITRCFKNYNGYGAGSETLQRCGAWFQNSKGKSTNNGYKADDIAEYLGLSYASLGMTMESIAAFTEALLVRESDSLLLAIAEQYYKANELNAAEQYLFRIIKNSDNEDIVLKSENLLGTIYIDKEDYEGALKEFENVLKKNENSADAHYGIGVIYEKQGNIVKARSEWRKALKIQVNHPGALQKMSEN